MNLNCPCNFYLILESVKPMSHPKNCFILLICLIFLFNTGCNRQKNPAFKEIPEIVWMGSVQDYPSIQTGISYDVTAVKPTVDNGFILAAYVYYEKTLFDALLVKINATGKVEWTKTYGGKDFETDIIHNIVVLPHGGYICVGLTYSRDIEGYHSSGSLITGQGDGWVLRLDNDGNVLWQKAYGGYNFDKFRSGLLAPDGHIIIAGETQSKVTTDNADNGNFDNWVIEIDTNGTVIWQKQFGAEGIDRIYDMALFNDSGIILLGGTNFIDNTLTVNYNTTLTMMNIKQGNIIWTKTWGGEAWDIGYSVAVDEQKRIVIAGKSESKTGNFKNKGMTDAFVSTFDSLGNNIWCKNFGGSLNDYFYKIIALKDKYIAIGTSISYDKDLVKKPFKIYDPKKNADVIIAQLNLDGSLDKFHILSGSNLDVGRGITAYNKDSYFVFGYTSSADGHFKNTKSSLWYALLKK